MDLYQKLKEAGYGGKNVRQRKIDSGDDGTFYGLFLTPKMKLCYTIYIYEYIWEPQTFTAYHDSERSLETYNYFKLKDGETVNGNFPLPWKRSLGHPLTIDNKEETPIEEFKSKLNKMKRQPPREFQSMNPYYAIDTFIELIL